MIYREFVKRQEDMFLKNMEHIRIDQKQILNSIWANTYQAKEKRLGMHIANLLRSHWRTSNVKPNETNQLRLTVSHGSNETCQAA